jgi:hypothetical protein
MHARHKNGTYAKLVERPDGKLMRYRRDKDLSIAMAETVIFDHSTTKELLERRGWTILPDTIDTVSVGQMVKTEDGIYSRCLADLGGFGDLRCLLMSHFTEEIEGTGSDYLKRTKCVFTVFEMKRSNFTVVQPEQPTKSEVEAAKKLLEAEGFSVSR